MKKLSIIIFFLQTLFATIINVPDDYATIHEAISASLPLDTIFVSNGTYVTYIEIENKS